MTLLVLAGTSDARKVLECLEGTDVTASLAGETRSPAELPATTRIGGFGGVEGFRDYLIAHNIKGVLDATHPFASVMTHTAAKVCDDLKLPHVVLQRVGWKPQAGDTWHYVGSVVQTADIIPKGATVFLGTGRKTLPEFACLSGRTLINRVIDTPQKPFPFENGEFLVGTPPFTIAEEVAMFREKRIDWVVVKNAGGDKSRSKLDAARELGLPVVLIKRPKLPKADIVKTVDAAVDWVKAQAW